MTTGSRMKNRRKEIGVPVDAIAAALGVSIATVYRYENGDIEKVPGAALEPLANVLHTTPAYLMGWEDDPEAIVANRKTSSLQASSNLIPFSTDRIPLVGRIACGEPILAEEHVEDHVDLPRHIKADFALECRGDSMVGAGIRDGDIVYIRQQPTVENGEIAAVVIGGEEANLKRFYKDGSKVILSAENPSYAPFIFVGDEINNIRIVGRAVGYTHKL